MTFNSGKSWTDDCDKSLINMHMYNSSNDVIAKAIGRTEFAVECRIVHLRKLGKLPPAPETVTKTDGTGLEHSPAVKKACKEINTLLEKKETPMTKLYKVEQVTKVNGYEVNTVSDDQLIQYIRELEKQATSLEEIEVASEAIHSRIDELRENAKAIAEILDSRQADK